MIAIARKADQSMPFHADLIGLHMLQIERGLHHDRLMHFLTLLSCSFLPPRDGALIQAESVDDRLARTARAEQRHHRYNEVFCLAQSFKHRPLMHTKGLSTRFPCVSLALFAMTHDVACPDFPSCRTLPGRAKELGCIFRYRCIVHPSQHTD